jgi:hypothetical protein
MALKDLKSDLSKFRRPIEKPLVDKKRVDVPKSTNQTPLSQFVDTTPSAPKSNTTTPKQGVTPNKFDNSSNFLGETNPTKFDNSSNYLGETTPAKMSLEERFLGQTETQEVQQGDKFKGETETTNITQGDRFKGQTTPQDYSNEEKFKGETTPSEFRFVQQFLGETTPNESSLTERFLGETTPNRMNLEARFLGETDVPDVVLESPFKGETTPNEFKFNPKLDQQAKEPKFVDFITNDDARGFSPFQQPKNNSTFVGVDPSQTQFDGVTPISGQFVLNQYGVNLQNDGGLGTSYTDSVLKTTYNKFNLKEDSYNSSIFKQPFILSGIQREKGEPQTLGLGSFSFIKGGAVTATAKAAIDVVRMSQFLVTPRGLTWIAKQEGLQRSQRYGKTFTPVNLLANLAGQHLGLRFDRPGVTPKGDETWKYQAGKPFNGSSIVEATNYPNGLLRLHRKLDDKSNFILKSDYRGGFDSFYGIGVSETKRVSNTRGAVTPDTIDYANPYTKLDDSSLISQTQGVTQDAPVDKVFGERGLYKSEGLLPDVADIADYEAISYGTIQKVSNGDKPSNYKGDFRNLKDSKFNISAETVAGSDYETKNIHSTNGVPQTFKTNYERIDPNNKARRSDSIYQSLYQSKLQEDLVHLFFAYDQSNGTQDDSKIIQFRSTINGVTETFSPSWNGIKYPGRADKAYMYSEFERTLSFNFKAYATSKDEMYTMFEKLSHLSRLTMPTYSGGVYSGHICYFRLGDLWGTGKNGVPSLITSLSYTIPDDLPWDINHNNDFYEIPMGIDVNIGLTILPETIYKSSKHHYSMFENPPEPTPTIRSTKPKAATGNVPPILQPAANSNITVPAFNPADFGIDLSSQQDATYVAPPIIF